MNNYLAILAEIKTKLTAVPGTGLVHDYERQAKTPAEFIALFTKNGKIIGWEITRKAAPEHSRGAHFRHHQFVLKGYAGLQDAAASSKAFQSLCDDICTAFRVAEPANPASPWDYMNGDNPDESPAQLESINDLTFGGILCHCAVISLSVTERIT